MRGWAKFLWIVTIGAVLAGCGQGLDFGRKGQAAVVGPEELAKVGLQCYWPRELAMDEGESLRNLWRLDENLYCLTSRNRLYVIDAAKGLLRWQCDLGDPGAAVFPPVHANQALLPKAVLGIKDMLLPRGGPAITPVDLVMFNTLTELLVLERKTGELYRRIKFEFSASTSGATDGDYFYVGSTNGRYYTIRLAEAVRVWEGTSEGIIAAPPVVFGGRLYVASTDGGLDALQTGDRLRRVWRSEDKGSQAMRGPVNAPFHVDERGCFIPCEDYRLYAFQLATGSPLWPPVICKGPLRDAVQVGEQTIFQYARDDGFYAINITNGQQRWRLPEGRKVLALMDGDVYLQDAGRNLLIVDEVLGKVKASVPLTGLDILVPNLKAAAIYAGTSDGKVLCIRPLSAGRLTPEMLREPVRKP